MLDPRKVPSALLRSPGALRDRWARARASAIRRHGDGTRLYHVAWTMLAPSPSPPSPASPADSPAADSRAAEPSTPRPGRHRKPRAGGEVDLETMGKQELYRLARELEVPGRSKMNKRQLVEALGQTPASSTPANR